MEHLSFGGMQSNNMAYLRIVYAAFDVMAIINESFEMRG